MIQKVVVDSDGNVPCVYCGVKVPFAKASMIGDAGFSCGANTCRQPVEPLSIDGITLKKSLWRSTGMRILLASGIAVALVFAVAWGVREYQRDPEIRTIDGVVHMTSGQLAKAYSNDQWAANDLYLDKVLQITGVVDGVGYEISSGAPFVDLKGPDYFGPVCVASEGVDSGLSSLVSGQKVVLRGTSRGQHITSPLLIGCVLVSVE